MTSPATQPTAPAAMPSTMASSTPTKSAQPIVEQRADGGDAADIGARFLDRREVAVFRGQLGDVLGQKVRSVGNGIVVEHAGERGRAKMAATCAFISRQSPL